MSQTISYVRDVEIISEPDILVCGLGSAGIAAAIGGARQNVKTMAVENWPFAGGNITASNVVGACGIADQSTGQIAVGGIALELLQRTGELPNPLPSKKLFEPCLDEELLATSATSAKMPINWPVEEFKYEADKMLRECNVDTLFHSTIIDVVTNNGNCEYVLVANKSGIGAIKPKIVIDCTGDGDVAALSGEGFEKSPEMQPCSLAFYIGNVRVGDENSPDLYFRCKNALDEASVRGDLRYFGGPWNVYYKDRDIAWINSVRLPYDSSDTKAFTEAEFEGRKSAWAIFNALKTNVKEFKNSYFLFSGPSVGPRESRRINGIYRLTVQDLWQNTNFNDVIGRGGWFIDRHPVASSGAHPAKFSRSY